MLMVLILGGSHILYRKTQVLLVASKKNGLEVKTKFMVMYRDQSVGRSHKFLWKGGRIQIFGNKITYLITYLFTYLLTYLIHGAESLRS